MKLQKKKPKTRKQKQFQNKQNHSKNVWLQYHNLLVLFENMENVNQVKNRFLLKIIPFAWDYLDFDKNLLIA